ncbi:MAG TPA: carboxypeptidase-like regulatory domain-containing protein [Dongiaceae bacterium]|nr:carboxypeptidase-like regulatory domain-containing protein [Dongiaceae bacterium]
MSRVAPSLTVAALLLATTAAGAGAQMMPQPQTENGVTFISGGIAEDQQQDIQSQRGQYNLHLLFAQQGTGAYFSGVGVQVTDASGRTVLDTVSNGPFLYARLAPGRYTVTATHNGDPQTKTAYVPAAGGVDLNYYWAGS